MLNKNILRILLGTALLLMILFVVMQFSDEMAWTGGDFVAAGILLSGTGIMFELGTRKAGHIAQRFAVGLAVGAALLLIWLNLAVGIIGSEDHPANLLYAGVIVIALAGTALSRFRPAGMARAMFAAAFAEALIPLIALLAGFRPTVFLDLFFVGMWFVSALLFRHASLVVAKANPSAR